MNRHASCCANGVQKRARRESTMLCDRIVTPGANGADSWNAPDDYVDLEWWELHQRALRKSTRCGSEIRILLPLGALLHNGDRISDAQGKVQIQVCVVPQELIIIRPRDASEMGLLALEIGNLHIPAQIVDCTMRVPADGPAEAVAVELGLPYEREVARLEPHRCAGMPDLQISPDITVLRT